jgi:ketosteroid isomerase-like protein
LKFAGTLNGYGRRKPMTTNVELVQAAVEAFGRGDIPALLDLCDENVTVEFPVGQPTAIPYAGRWSGKARLGDYFQAIGGSFDVLKWEPHHYVGSGDRVAVFGSLAVQARATGKMVTDSPWALDFTVANGKVSGWTVYADTAAQEKALTT